MYWLFTFNYALKFRCFKNIFLIKTTLHKYKVKMTFFKKTKDKAKLILALE